MEFTAPVTDHPASDAAGDHLGETDSQFWRDHQSAKVNAIRTRTLIEQSDMVVVRFGDQYKQWNAAFDAGYCAALGKPYVTLHEADIVHPLKEVDAEAQAWCTTTDHGGPMGPSPVCMCTDRMLCQVHLDSGSYWTTECSQTPL